ncbi:hypothetical protein Sjap_019974 [Stephania japonica]|uniref:RanBP2-type domain-containing protein n=1 Tax=Stephania japonica TaxID=461633 RepID=A0AAP0I024_9MAGN
MRISSEQSPVRQHPHLSSLVIRPSDSGGGGGGGSDYEPGEVRPPYSRSDRFTETNGHGKRAGSISPIRRRKVDHYRDNFDGMGQRGRGFRGGRGLRSFRDSSPPYGRGRGGGGRFSDRAFDDDEFDKRGLNRNNPNVAPREGDWFCPDPLCGNLNFARRDFCNNCDKPRSRPGDSPRNFPRPPPPRFSSPPISRSLDRGMNGFRSPPPLPLPWGRDGPRDITPPHPRPGGRLPDYHPRRERPVLREEDDFGERGRFDRAMMPQWVTRDRGRVSFSARRGFGIRNELRPMTPPPLAPPPLPPRAQWARDIRERSRSPIRNGRTPPSKDRHRDLFIDGRGRGSRWGMPRGRGRGRFDVRPY